jgi:FkbM family methyltransferase
MLEHPWDLDSVDFPLTEDSVVFEIGGYEGRWAKEISERYHPLLLAYEPQDWAFEKCTEALMDYPNSHVHHVGLGVETGFFDMGNYGTDGCSFVNLPSGKPVGIGQLVEISKHLAGVKHIDLCLMNIEGYEFKLIPYMIETGIMDRIDYFMCQFHLNLGNENEYHDLRRELSKTKKIRFDYGPILTCWEPK